MQKYVSFAGNPDGTVLNPAIWTQGLSSATTNTINSNRLRLSCPASDAGAVMWTETDDPCMQGEILTMFQRDSTSISVSINIGANNKDAVPYNGYHNCMALQIASSLINIRIMDPGLVTVGSVALTVPANTDYMARFRREGVNLKGKVWAAASPEPTAWTVEGSYTAYGNAVNRYVALGVDNPAGAVRTASFTWVQYTSLYNGLIKSALTI